MNPYRELANAIIVKAARDYRSALWMLKRDPWNENAERMKRDVESFFRSKWYQSLTELDGEWMLRKLREEVNRCQRRNISSRLISLICLSTES